ncbi:MULTISPECIES: hypothetical protein [unclassified Microbacterium]|uniref:hypothetical protein n=1 Tax=unclassified Microbacterium TaxID=2609290 RepID=UPI00214C7B1E|nr:MULTISPECIES: hypothetical protein [unclassified Microbacterium]MCR2785098.1 hypothetical protein [Microbacterium sp. zg.B96]WIM16631.1 hypothetical protein QNO11_03045 [Microbacterium sp. zg-B96]
MTARTTTSPAVKRTTRPAAKRGAAKTPRVILADRLFFWTGMTIVAFGLLPIILIAVIGLIQGTLPSEADGSITGTAAGFPLFQPPFWLLWLPAVGMLALTVITWPFPARFPAYFWGARFDMSVISGLGLMTTLVAAVAYGGAQLWLVLPAAGAFLLAMIVFGVRGTIEYVRDIVELRRPTRR